MGQLRRVVALGILLFAGALVGALWVIRSRSVSGQPDVSGYPVRGIDVSSHNGEIDFRKVAQSGISFVFVKATEGSGFRDPRFARNYYAAREAGLKVGAYHFYRFDRSPDMQAVNLLHVVRGRPLDLPVVIDVEEWTNPDDVGVSNVAAGVDAMARYLTDRGLTVMVYSNKKDYGRYVTRLSGRGMPLWLCSLADIPSGMPWTFWQYSHRGEVDGVSGNVDLNVYAGSDSLWQVHLNQWYRLVE